MMRALVPLALALLVAASARAQCPVPGLVGDARNGQGQWNAQPTDNRAALQAAIDACPGGILEIPAGMYYVRAKGGGAALAITKPMQLRAAPEAVLFIDGDAQTDALLLEIPYDVHAWSSYRPIEVAVTIRGWHFASASYRHGIVSHGFGFYIHDSQVDEAAGWGVLIESGTAGSSLEGATLLPQGQYTNSNTSRVDRVLVADDGRQDLVGGTVDGGGGIRVHGSDANGIEVANVFCTYAPTCFADGSLEGVTWRRNYVEVGGPSQAIGYADWSAAGARYYDCREEIQHPSVPGLHSRSFGSTTLFRGTPAASVDAELASIASPMRNTVPHWTWRQTPVTLPPGASVVRSAPNWSYSYGLWRGDARTAADRVHVVATPEMHTVNVWGSRLSPQAADAQVAQRAAALLAVDVTCGPVATGYQDDAGGLFLVRCVNATPNPVTLDMVWSAEMWTPSSPNGGP